MHSAHRHKETRTNPRLMLGSVNLCSGMQSDLIQELPSAVLLIVPDEHLHSGIRATKTWNMDVDTGTKTVAGSCCCAVFHLIQTMVLHGSERDQKIQILRIQCHSKTDCWLCIFSVHCIKVTQLSN